MQQRLGDRDGLLSAVPRIHAFCLRKTMIKAGNGIYRGGVTLLDVDGQAI